MVSVLILVSLFTGHAQSHRVSGDFKPNGKAGNYAVLRNERDASIAIGHRGKSNPIKYLLVGPAVAIQDAESRDDLIVGSGWAIATTLVATLPNLVAWRISPQPGRFVFQQLFWEISSGVKTAEGLLFLVEKPPRSEGMPSSMVLILFTKEGSVISKSVDPWVNRFQVKGSDACFWLANGGDFSYEVPLHELFPSIYKS